MYSTIQKKMCKCGCNRPPSIGYNGYRFSCAPEDIKEKVGTKNEVARKNKNNRNALSRKLHAAQDEVDEEKKLSDLWFTKIALEIRENPHCWECHAWIAPEYYRHATAHIFPKTPDGGFPSVATHPMNYLILGAGCGCHNKTHRLDTFSKMGIWKEAVDRFKIFEPCITERHRYLNHFKYLAYQ